MSCNDPVVGDLFCTSTVKILDIKIENEPGWFWGSVLLAFGLQFVANVLWLKTSQISRQLLQTDLPSKKCCAHRPLCNEDMWSSVAFTILSTLVWIVRILLLIGNNIYIFIAILIGNVLGVWFTQVTEKKDKAHLANSIESMLGKLCNEKCNSQVKSDIKVALVKLGEAIEKARKESSTKPAGPMNQVQPYSLHRRQIAF